MKDQPVWSEKASAQAEGWLRDHGDFLYRYAKSRVLDPGWAEDLVQETLLTAMERYDQFRADSSERTWLTGILRFKILEHFRRQASETKAFAPEPERHEEESWFDEAGHWSHEAKNAGMDWKPNPRHALEQKEFWDVLQHCLKQLPPRTAAVFAQRELEFVEPTEIKNTLNITESNLWVLLHRARNLLRRCLRSHWHVE